MPTVEYDLRLRDRDFKRGIRDANNGFKRVDDRVEEVNRELRRSNSLARSLGRSVSGVASRGFVALTKAATAFGIAVAAAVGGFTALSRSTSAEVRALEKFGQSLGTTGSELFALDRIFGQVGVSTQDVVRGVIAAIRRAEEGNTELFERLGTTGQEFINLPFAKQLDAFTAASRRFNNEAEFTAFITSLTNRQFAAASPILARMEQSWVDVLAQQRTFDAETGRILTETANRWDDFDSDIKQIAFEFAASIAPIFDAWFDLWDNQIFPYLEGDVIPRVETFANTIAAPFAQGFFGLVSEAELRRQKEGLESLIRLESPPAPRQILIDQLQQINNQLEGIEQRQSVDEALGTLAEGIILVADTIEPFIAGGRKLFDFFDNLEALDIAAIASTFSQSFSKLSVTASILTLLGGLGNSDITKISAAISQVLGQALNKALESLSTNEQLQADIAQRLGEILRVQITPDDVLKIVENLKSALITAGRLLIIEDIADLGKSIAAAIGTVIRKAPIIATVADALDTSLRLFSISQFGNIIVDFFTDRYREAADFVQKNVKFKNAVKFLGTKVGAFALGGLVDGIIEAFSDDATFGSVFYEALAGALIAVAFAVNPFLGVGAIITKLILDSIAGGDLRQGIIDIFDQIALSVVSGFYGIFNDIAGEINQAVLAFNNFKIAGVNVNPFNIPLFPTLDASGIEARQAELNQRIRLRTDPRYQPYSNETERFNRASNIGAQGQDIVIRTIFNLDGKFFEEAVTRVVLQNQRTGVTE